MITLKKNETCTILQICRFVMNLSYIKKIHIIIGTVQDTESLMLK